MLTLARRPPRAVHRYEGRGRLISPEGDVLWEDPEWMANVSTDEGEESLLNVYLREQAHPAKHLCLIEGGTTPPGELSTMAYLGGGVGAREVKVPGTDGYASPRPQIALGDWSVPALDSGDMQSSAAEKTFGPAATNGWTGITHVGLVTAGTGQLAGSGKFLAFIALSGTIAVPIGVSFKYIFRWKNT